MSQHHWSGKLSDRQVHTPQALRCEAMCDIFSAAGIHVSSYHRGNLILYCRSTWTRTTTRVWHPPHNLVHTLHPCKDTELRSWHLQILWVRARRKPSTIAYSGRERKIQACIAEARWHALHHSWLLTWVLLRTLLARRHLALAVILHGPVHLVKVTLPPTLLGAISLDSRVVRVGSVALVVRAVCHGTCTVYQAT